jgi:hypothetical protein
VKTTTAMEMAFHFFMTIPENPTVADTLIHTIENFVLQKFWSDAFDEAEDEGKPWTTTMARMRENEMVWLGKTVELMQAASSRGKDDALVQVIALILLALRRIGRC